MQKILIACLALAIADGAWACTALNFAHRREADFHRADVVVKGALMPITPNCASWKLGCKMQMVADEVIKGPAKATYALRSDYSISMCVPIILEVGVKATFYLQIMDGQYLMIRSEKAGF